MQLPEPNGPRHLVKSEEFPHLGGNILEGDPGTWEPDLWTWLLSSFRVNTVLDVGCGSGHSTQWFRDAGCVALGLDGLPRNVAACGAPAILCDLTQPPALLPMVDMVWCCEMVEHVEASYLPHLLKALSSGRVVAMTHADIGQGGHHHVNCRPSAYWIQAMESMGYTFLVKETGEGRALCDPINHFHQRGLIFRRGA